MQPQLSATSGGKATAPVSLQAVDLALEGLRHRNEMLTRIILFLACALIIALTSVAWLIGPKVALIAWGAIVIAMFSFRD